MTISFLRVRGGVSPSAQLSQSGTKFSPRTRRCFLHLKRHFSTLKVFSAYAEVFPKMTGYPMPRGSFLRVRGGVSAWDVSAATRTRFSPRTRRCFSIFRTFKHSRKVFSAYAEVFPHSTARAFMPNCFLRVRGGVSIFEQSLYQFFEFSPRTRRCFFGEETARSHYHVFSAYAEVFRAPKYNIFENLRFLRVRGGVSFPLPGTAKSSVFSPRTRRCFLLCN